MRAAGGYLWVICEVRGDALPDIADQSGTGRPSALRALHSSISVTYFPWRSPAFRPVAGHGGLIPLTSFLFPQGSILIRCTGAFFFTFARTHLKSDLIVDGGMAGFVPQKEIVYNGLLPYSDRLDREATELLAEIKANLSRAVLLRELWPGVAFWSRKLFS